MTKSRSAADSQPRVSSEGTESDTRRVEVAVVKVADLLGAGSETLEAQQWRFQRSIANGLLALARHRPFVLLLEDAQWADAPTMNLLAFIVKAVVLAREQKQVVRLGIVVTQRPAPDHVSLESFVAQAKAEQACEQIDLQPLDAETAAGLVASMLSAEVDEPLVQFTHKLLDNAAGNPLYLAQILHSLVASGQLVREPGGWNVGDAGLRAVKLPNTIREAIGDRAARFAVGTKSALACAAVIGRQFSLGLLESVLRVDQYELLDCLDEGVRSGFIEEVPGTSDAYRFTHDRFRESIYERSAAEDRQDLHRRIAVQMESISEGRPEAARDLAYHFKEGGDDQKGYQFSIAAADHAMQTYGFAQAAELYEQAIDLASRLKLTPPLMLIDRFGDSCVQSGRYDEASASFRQCLESLTKPLEKAEMLRKVADVEHRRGNTPGAASLNEEVLRMLGFRVPGRGWSLVPALLMQFISFLRYVIFPHPLELSRRKNDEALAIIARTCIRLTESFYFMDFLRAGFYLLAAGVNAERLGVSKELTSASSQAGYVLSLWGLYRVGKRLLDRAQRCVEIVPSPLDEGWELTLRGYYYTAIGKPRQQILECLRAEAIYKRASETLRLRQVLAVHADGPLAMGDLVEAERLGNQLWQMAEDVRDARGIGWGLGTLGHVQLRREHLPQAIDLLRSAVASSREAGDTAFRLAYTGRLVTALALDGALDEAVTLGLEGSSELARTFIRHPSVALDGSFLGAAALLRMRSGPLPANVEKAVRHVIRWRWHYAHSITQSRPWFWAGVAAWDLATGHLERGRAKLRKAIEEAARYEYLGEEHDIHWFASKLFPAGSEDAQGHAARASELLRVMTSSADHTRPRA